MEISINATSRELIDKVSSSPALGDYFKTIELMRANKIKSLTDYLGLAKGTLLAVGIIKDRLKNTTNAARKVAVCVTDCYNTHLETGRTFPYDMYLALVDKTDITARTLSSRDDMTGVNACLETLAKLKFDNQDEIIESASAVYVILAALYGWERNIEVPPTKHIPM